MKNVIVKSMRRSGTHRTIDNVHANLPKKSEGHETLENYISENGDELIKRVENCKKAGFWVVLKNPSDGY